MLLSAAFGLLSAKDTHQSLPRLSHRSLQSHLTVFLQRAQVLKPHKLQNKTKGCSSHKDRIVATLVSQNVEGCPIPYLTEYGARSTIQERSPGYCHRCIPHELPQAPGRKRSPLTRRSLTPAGSPSEETSGRRAVALSLLSIPPARWPSGTSRPFGSLVSGNQTDARCAATSATSAIGDLSRLAPGLRLRGR